MIPTIKGKTMSLNDASMGFKNQGQFIAALHVSQNLNIPFMDLKNAMVTKTGTGATAEFKQTSSLGQAIQTVKKNADATTEVEKAETQASADVTTSSSTTTPTKNKKKKTRRTGGRHRHVLHQRQGQHLRRYGCEGRSFADRRDPRCRRGGGSAARREPLSGGLAGQPRSLTGTGADVRSHRNFFARRVVRGRRRRVSGEPARRRVVVVHAIVGAHRSRRREPRSARAVGRRLVFREAADRHLRVGRAYHRDNG